MKTQTLLAPGNAVYTVWSLQDLEGLARRFGFLLLPVGYVRRTTTSYLLDERTSDRLVSTEGDLTRAERYIDEMSCRAIANKVKEVATREVWPDPVHPARRYTLHMTTVDVPAYLRWASRHGIKPFLTPHGFNPL